MSTEQTDRENERDPDIVFEFSIGGYFGTSHIVTVRDRVDRLDVQHVAIPEGKYIEEEDLPSAGDHEFWTSEQWKDFLIEFLLCGVMPWKKDYPNPGIIDGYGWSLFCRFPEGTTLESGGSNAAPRRFNRFLKLMKRSFGDDIE